MSDKPNIPSMGDSSRNLTRNELQKQNSELKKEIESVDERKAGQEMRERELAEREQDLKQREQALTALANVAEQENMRDKEHQPIGDRGHRQLPPRVSTSEDVLKENTQAAINSRSMRNPLEMGKKFPDITAYLQKYGKEFQLMWINDVDGDVQRWIDLGAEPVEWNTERNRAFAGITDQHETQWVRVVGGETRAGAFHVYLLKISYAEYHRIKIAPQQHRQELIKRSMTLGADQSSYGDGPGLQTYAPNLPSGQQGLEQLREVAGEIPGL